MRNAHFGADLEMTLPSSPWFWVNLSIRKIPKPTFLVERGDIIGDPRPGAVEVLPLLPRQLGTLPPC